jgi:hypothetical protein
MLVYRGGSSREELWVLYLFLLFAVAGDRTQILLHIRHVVLAVDHSAGMYMESLLCLSGPVSSYLDVQSKNLQCRQLLQFLQKNILIPTIMMAAILVITVLLLLMFSAHIWRKQL